MERFFKQLTAFLAIAFLATLILFAAFSGRDRREIARLEQNRLVLTDSVRVYRVSNSLNAVQVKALKLTASEYKELYAHGTWDYQLSALIKHIMYTQSQE